MGNPPTFADRALLLDDVLVIADLHLGKDAASAVEWPLGEGEDLVEHFEALCERFKPAEVVIAGDLLHSFETVPRGVENTLARIRSVGERLDGPVTVTPGNHDTMLEVIWDGPTTPEYRIGDTVVCHGHVEPASEADRYVIGHEHPTIEIEGQRHACHLVGDGVYEGADLIVLPAFNRLLKGVAINRLSAAEYMSPMIRDADALAPVIAHEGTDDPLRFPPMGTLRESL